MEGGGGYSLDGGVPRAVYLGWLLLEQASLHVRTKCNDASRKFPRNWITLVYHETKRVRMREGEEK